MAAKKFEILLLNQISQIGLKRFPAEGYRIVKDAAILVRSHEMHSMAIAESVRGAPVFNAPGANANAVKELVLAGMLMAARNLVPAVRFVGSLNCDDDTLAKRVSALMVVDQVRDYLENGNIRSSTWTAR